VTDASFVDLGDGGGMRPREDTLNALASNTDGQWELSESAAFSLSTGLLIAIGTSTFLIAARHLGL
jgi:hypothetical protein